MQYYENNEENPHWWFRLSIGLRLLLASCIFVIIWAVLPSDKNNADEQQPSAKITSSQVLNK